MDKILCFDSCNQTWHRSKQQYKLWQKNWPNMSVVLHLFCDVGHIDKIKRTTKKRVVCFAHCGTSCSRSLLYILPLWQVCTWLQFPLGSKSSLLLTFLWCFVGEELAFHWDWLWSSFVHFFLHQINYKKELILAELW